MIYSVSCEYAIRALVYLARQTQGHYCTIEEIHDQEQIPRSFIAKLLQTLAKQGMVNSRKGPGGGFTLARSADEITLYDVMKQMDGVEQISRCIVGLGVCSDGRNCPVDYAWCHIRYGLIEMLESQTIGELAERRYLQPNHTDCPGKGGVS